MPTRNQFTPRVESLDSRSLPSITLSNGVLTVLGTGGDDVIQISSPVAGQIQASVSTTGEVHRFSLARISGLNIQGGNGNDRILVASNLAVPAEIHGGRGNDFINGGGGADNISGDRGSDTIRGRGGDDTIHGSTGNDELHGGDGNDGLFGDAGDDRLQGENGDDMDDGDDGHNMINGGPGHNDNRNGEVEVTLAAKLVPVVGTEGHGSASFSSKTETNANQTENETEQEVEVEDLTPNATATITVDGVDVGDVTLDAKGRGKLKFKAEAEEGVTNSNFPADFPAIQDGSVITVQVGGTTVLQGTFAAGN